MLTKKLYGCGTALVTPFRDGKVDYDAYAALVDRQIRAGIHFLVPLGTTGETPCLDASERSGILELTMEHRLNTITRKRTMSATSYCMKRASSVIRSTKNICTTINVLKVLMKAAKLLTIRLNVTCLMQSLPLLLTEL